MAIGVKERHQWIRLYLDTGGFALLLKVYAQACCMLGNAADNRCERLVHLCVFITIMLSAAQALHAKHVLACPTLVIYPPPPLSWAAGLSSCR